MNKENQLIFLMMAFLISMIFSIVGKVDHKYIGFVWIVFAIGMFVITYIKEKRNNSSKN